MSTHLGRQGVALPSNSLGDLPPSSPFGEEGGRHLHCPGSGVWNQQGRDQGPVLPSVQAPRITRVPTMWARMDREIGWGCGVLLEKLPEAERGPTTKRTRRVQTSSCPAIMEQDPQKKEEGHFCQKRPHQGKGSQLKTSSSCGCLGRKNRKAELVHL